MRTRNKTQEQKRIERLKGRIATLGQKRTALRKALSAAEENEFKNHQVLRRLGAASLGVSARTPAGSAISAQKEARILPRLNRLSREEARLKKQIQFLREKIEPVEEAIEAAKEEITALQSVKKANPGRRGLRGATAKQERQYEAIKRSERRAGRSLKDAKRIAAATVRKRAENTTVIKAKRVKVLATNPRRRRRKNAVALPALTSSLRQQYDPIQLRKLRDRLRTNIQSYQQLTRKLTKELKTLKDPSRAQSLQRQLAEIERLESREVDQLDDVLRRLSGATTIRKPRRNPNHRFTFAGVLRFKYPGKKEEFENIVGRVEAAGYDEVIDDIKHEYAKDYVSAEYWKINGEIQRKEKGITVEKKTFSIGSNPSRRQNSGVTSKSRATRKLFTGIRSTRTLSPLAPRGTPKSVAILGKLVKIKTRSKTFTPPKRGRNPEGDIWLAADDGGNLHIVGETLPIVPGPARDLGEILDIEYATKKPHLGYGSTTEFYHHLGEEGGERPHLVTDSEGHLKIVGGDYYIERDGIHD